MKTMNVNKYQPYPPFPFPERTWPEKTITRAPIWCSVDLRDGNQALNIPMTVEEKIRLFELLVSIGFREIEVGFPSASEIEYRFVRKLIEENRIPDDVTIQILTQSREHLIRRSFESLKGAKKAIVHLYNSTSALQREVVFNMNKDQIKHIAVTGAELMQHLKEEIKMPGVRFEYSPESFTGTETEYALEVCHAVMAVLKPDANNKMILNLPATVEMSTPNIYADKIEWFSRHINNRENVIISIHTHNDRGCAVAAGELALMAGADRVEGTLFGNGERTGNMDLVTMALNLFSQGVEPGLDFSDINKIKEIYSQCTKMQVHERHPYAGDLVYTAFSGSHQDAINKGMKAQKGRKIWTVPYLPIDPADVGRTYESIIRINSQSGKGGVAFIMEQEFGFKLPKPMHAEFGRIIQNITDKTNNELTPSEIKAVFENEYLQKKTPYSLNQCSISMTDKGETQILASLVIHEETIEFQGQGNGPIDAFVKGISPVIKKDLTLKSYDEHALSQGSDSSAVAYISISSLNKTSFGVGVDPNISFASIKAVLSALNRL
ncbi:MAG: 2-isopropylmalate synthase [Candidatus Aureabacteria bacterium]|nr:2-isopropylmalate synthase [Candidatus Auribacterota bacterium]